MTFPSNDSPFWPLAKSIVVATVIIVGAVTLTKNGFAPSDAMIVLGAVGGIFGVDAVKRVTNQEPK